MLESREYNRSTLILGAGELGMSVLRSFAAVAHAQTIAVLLRPENGEPASPAKKKKLEELHSLGVSPVVGDLASISAPELAKILRGYDTLVSCTGFVGGRGTQRKIAEAALLAGVRRFVPWQFGVDYDVIGRGSAQDLFDEQLDVRALLRSQTQTQWVIVSTGMFTSFLFEPAFGVFDLAKGAVHALGGWENAVTLTTAEDVGRLTVTVLTAEPQVVNETIFVAGETVTYRQAADLVDEILKIKLNREVWTVRQLRARLELDPDNAMAKYRLVFAEGRGVSWSESNTFNQERGIPVCGLGQYLKAQGHTLLK